MARAVVSNGSLSHSFGHLALSVPAKLTTRIADIIFSLTGLTADWVWTDRERFETCLSDDAPDSELRVHVDGSEGHRARGQLVRSVGGLRNVYLDETTWTFEFRPYKKETYPQRPPHQVLVYDRQFTRGDLYVAKDAKGERSPFSFGVFVSDLLTAMLPFHEGMMVHASGIADGRRGIVFAGPSGAGKSTMAGLWEGYDGVRVLNDDRIILRKKDGQWRAYPRLGVGEPRSGSSEGVPLEAVFLIHHASENAARRMNSSGGARSLLAHLSLPAYDAAATRATLQLLDDLLHQVPVYHLGFCPEEAIVGFARDIVRRGQAPDGVPGQDRVAAEDD